MKTLILVGGGHAHLHCLHQLNREHPTFKGNVLLISSSSYQYYSGMFSGFTEGTYNLEDIRVNLTQFAKSSNVTFIQDTITKIDPISKVLIGLEGRFYEYDIVSFDVGSQVAIPETFKPHALNIKPNFNFADHILSIRESSHPLVVGGGASGVELALSILSWRKKHQIEPNVTLVSSTSLLSQQGNAISQKIETIAKQKGLTFFTNESVTTIHEHTIVTNQERVLPHSMVLWLTGPKAPAFFKESNLPVDGYGFLLVNDGLQSIQHPEIFGAGDCITMATFPLLTKNGVYAVRQGPILWENIKRAISSNVLLSFKPQKRFLSILSTGENEGLLSYGASSLHGSFPWRLKQKIDQQFMNQYKRLYK